MGGRSGTVGRRDKSRSASNWWAVSKEPLPKCKNTYRHGEWRSEVEQHQKFSSDEIGSPRVDLQSTIASPPPNLPPVFARSMTPLPTIPRPPTPQSFPSIGIGCLNGFNPSRPRRHRLWISPQPLPARSGIPLQPFEHRISRRILPIPPAPAVFDLHVIDVGSIRQEDITKGAPVLVEAVRRRSRGSLTLPATCGA
jgi:hypothetical protein